MNPILIGIILAALGAGSSLYWRQAAIESKLLLQTELARIAQESAIAKQQSEEYINGIEAQRIKEKIAADNRIQQLSRKLERPAVTSCVTSPSGIVSAHIDDSVIGLLIDTANDSRLSKDGGSTAFVSADTTITADTLTAYTFHVMTQYNEIAAECNALKDMVK